MRPAFLLMAAIAVLGMRVALAAPVNLSGDWYFDVKSQNGTGRRDVLFRQEGNRVIGFIESDSASGRFVGSVSGRNLEFTAVLEFGGQPMAARYRATVDGDSMAGTIDFGDYGRATFIGKRGRRPLAIRPEIPVTIEGSARGAALDVAVSGEYFGVARGDVLLPEMIDSPAGSFRMGNAGPAVKPEYGADFIHVHPVEISALRMSRFLITNAQYSAFVAATKREPLLPPRGWDEPDALPESPGRERELRGRRRVRGVAGGGDRRVVPTADRSRMGVRRPRRRSGPQLCFWRRMAGRRGQHCRLAHWQARRPRWLESLVGQRR